MLTDSMFRALEIPGLLRTRAEAFEHVRDFVESGADDVVAGDMMDGARRDLADVLRRAGAVRGGLAVIQFNRMNRVAYSLLESGEILRGVVVFGG